MKSAFFNIHKRILVSFLVAMIVGFSWFLMQSTLSYSQKSQSILIASKAWSDFGAHIPLIRSFSMGDNLHKLLSFQSVESPLYPSTPIRYHFGFYAIVGVLERLGVRLDYAVNILSALGLVLMLVMIFKVSYSLFTHYSVSVLSVLFVLLNGSLSFLQFFKLHPFSIRTPIDIISNTKFSSFGPWDGNLVSAFWTLNIYTNQRHLALSYGLSLLIFYITLQSITTRKKRVMTVITLALCMSVLMMIHFPAAIISAIFLAWFFLIRTKIRASLFWAGLCSLPSFLLLRQLTGITYIPHVEIGYLILKPITVYSFITYWFYNLGLHLFLMPLGLVLSPRDVRKLFLFPLFIVFLIPNMFRLSPDMINNHKFINFFMIIGSMFSAYALVWFWKFFRKQTSLIRPIGLISLIGITFFLVFSGVIDVFPVINDTKGAIADKYKQEDIQFFRTQTLPTDIIANSTWFYHPASLTGRAIFSGYTYFTWSYGYDQGKREEELISLYEAQSISDLCQNVTKYNIAFVELSKTPEDYLHPNLSLWNTLPVEYTNSTTGLRVFKTKTLCQNP